MKYGIIGWGRACGWMLLGLSQSIFGFQSSLQEQNRRTSCRQSSQQLVRPPGLLPGRAAIVCFYCSNSSLTAFCMAARRRWIFLAAAGTGGTSGYLSRGDDRIWGLAGRRDCSCAAFRAVEPCTEPSGSHPADKYPKRICRRLLRGMQGLCGISAGIRNLSLGQR